MPSKVEDLADEPPTSINPYKVLDLEKSATQDQIKTAYRKAALKHHPDKVSADEKDAANAKFQEIAFAYAILSDPRRRSRYDTTGRTSESLDIEDDDFNWTDFFRTQFKEVVTEAAIQKFKEEYVGSEEEKLAIIEAYVNGEGDMDHVFAHVMLSNPLEDDARFRAVIDAEIAEKRVEAYPAYTNETKQSKKRREKEAKKEAQEAIEMAREMGIEDKLFGDHSSSIKNGKRASGAKRKSQSNGDDTNGLAALIQQRQQSRASNFLADLEAKYAPTRGKRKAMDDEPPEEAFQRTAERYKRRSSGSSKQAERPIAPLPRKAKRNKS